MLDPSLEPQKILAVDDNTYTLRIVQHTLEHAGFQVLTAVSGKEALNLINRHGMPHLAIVDWHMPGMSGIEFWYAVREFSDMPVVMLTAVATEEDIVRTIETYAEDYIVKPFSPAELVARIKRVLRRMGDYSYT
ncbi:MAG: response regulator, partial [Anaerolineales bacterium]|nr:response regulator [Anaerolineales bacterium]